MRAIWDKVEHFIEGYGGLGIAAFLLISAAALLVNHLRLYTELRNFGLPTIGTWVSQRYVDRGDDPDLYEVTFEFSVDSQTYRVRQESREAYDLYGGPGEPATIIYSVNDPQTAQVVGTISLIPPFQVWLLGLFGLVMAVVSWRELRKKRRAGEKV